ncbi:MAG: cyclic nucleotide-binding domain-containing protein [bacterium]|nr:cyclic nucleotide-binding domain-containing protein [bacterium]
MQQEISNLSVHQDRHVFKSLKTLTGFTQESIGTLATMTQLITLSKGEVLFSQGDDAEFMYVVIKGRMQAVVKVKEDRENVVRELGPGNPLGIIPLLVGGKRNVTLSALKKTTLAKISQADFETLISRYAQVKANMLEIVFKRLRRIHLAEILPEYFDPIDEPTLDYIESLFQWVHIKRGQVLYNKGDVGDQLYILINGLLHVIDEGKSSPHRVLATIGRGKIVGEMAMLSDEIRSAAIHAARDCDLVKLSRSSFESISQQFPQIMMAITRILVDRLKNIGTERPPKKTALNFAVLPITPGVPASKFSQRLANAFSVYGSSILLTPKSLDNFMAKKGVSRISRNDPRDLGLRAYLAELESQYDFIIYQADSSHSVWTRRCITRVDQIILLADANSPPAISLIERQIEGDDHMTTTPRKIIALIHPDGSRIPERTAQWLDNRPIRGHHHIRWDHDADFGRLARILSNRAIGLVLGGGAAKGLAHIGVIRALEEAGIPIDMVGGASMGSIIGAHYAMGNNYEQMMALCKKLFIEINPFSEYTIPLVSLTRGKKLERMGQLAYGDINVEDLWLNYFCVSSNLTTSQVKIHRRGLLWKAVRTSSSIPGVISPVLEDGEIYVDGGVINNLPGDVMRRQCDIVIVVEVSPNLGMTTRVNEIPSPWKLLWRKIFPFKKAHKIPNIIDIMLSTVLTGSFIAANSVKMDADLSLTPPLDKIGFLDFKKMNKTAEIGYNYTHEILQHPSNQTILATLKGKEAPPRAQGNKIQPVV